VIIHDFDLAALYQALDAQRIARGLSWSQAAHEINRLSAGAPVRAISVSTLTSTRTKRVAEADGVLQMLRWLNRTPESFVPNHPRADDKSARLPNVPTSQILRFDTRALYAALDAQRHRSEMTWVQVAAEVGVSASSLTHLSEGGRTRFPDVMRMVQWLDRPAAAFTRACDK
jgi:hypothetical protein